MKSASTLMTLGAAAAASGIQLSMPRLNFGALNRPHLGSPPRNQRKTRQARRQRFAAGDRFAFKRH